MEIIYKEESYRIMGACFEVYKEMGCGFVEPVYQECLELELGIQELPFVAQRALRIRYKGKQLRRKFTPDFIIFGNIVVELKAVKELNDKHRAQVHNYLKATGYRLGLLINFGHYPKVQYERIVV